MGKRICCAALALAQLFTGSLAQGGSLSIRDIRKQTPARWTQRYETPWRIVDIDAPVCVPEVDAFPILRVARTPAVERAMLGEDCDVRVNDSGILSADFGKSRLRLSGQEEHRGSETFYGGEIPARTAQGSAISAEEAVEILLARVRQLTGHERGDFRLGSLAVEGPIWKYRLSGGEKTYTEQVTDAGDYAAKLEQLFHGIPYRACGTCDENRAREESWLFEAAVSGVVRTESAFTLTASLFDEIDAPCGDVPMLSFADAKAAIETEILAGHVRTVDRLELAYAPYLDPDRPGVFWLLPVWVARCGYARDAERAFVALDEEHLARTEVAVEALRGTFLICGERGSDRFVPETVLRTLPSD